MANYSEFRYEKKTKLKEKRKNSLSGVNVHKVNNLSLTSSKYGNFLLIIEGKVVEILLSTFILVK